MDKAEKKSFIKMKQGLLAEGQYLKFHKQVVEFVSGLVSAFMVESRHGFRHKFYYSRTWLAYMNIVHDRIKRE